MIADELVGSRSLTYTISTSHLDPLAFLWSASIHTRHREGVRANRHRGSYDEHLPSSVRPSIVSRCAQAHARTSTALSDECSWPRKPPLFSSPWSYACTQSSAPSFIISAFFEFLKRRCLGELVTPTSPIPRPDTISEPIDSVRDHLSSRALIRPAGDEPVNASGLCGPVTSP